METFVGVGDLGSKIRLQREKLVENNGFDFEFGRKREGERLKVYSYGKWRVECSRE